MKFLAISLTRQTDTIKAYIKKKDIKFTKTKADYERITNPICQKMQSLQIGIMKIYGNALARTNEKRLLFGNLHSDLLQLRSDYWKRLYDTSRNHN